MLESTLSEAAAVPDDPAVVAVLAGLARVQMQINAPDALETADRALAAAERLRVTRLVAEALITKGSDLDIQGRPFEGMALVRGGIEMAVENGWVDTELRGRSNLANMLFNDDPVAATDLVMDAREIARRLGSMHDYKWITFVCYGSSTVLGRWDWSLELTRDIEDCDPSPLDLEGVHGVRALVAAYRGEADLAATERALAVELAPEVTRPDFLAARHSDASEIAGLTGRLDEAYDEAMTALRIEPRVFTAYFACRWAVWARDLDKARAAAELLDLEQVRGRYADAIRTSARAGVAALAGERAAAVAGYRAAISTFRALATPVDLGLALMGFATLLGPGEAGTREAADEARAIFERLGANALIARLDIGLAGWPDAPAGRSAAASPVGRGEEEPAPER